jgi:hypothetical protein
LLFSAYQRRATTPIKGSLLPTKFKPIYTIGVGSPTRELCEIFAHSVKLNIIFRCFTTEPTREENPQKSNIKSVEALLWQSITGKVLFYEYYIFKSLEMGIPCNYLSFFY